MTDRNYFDARSYYFQVLTDRTPAHPNTSLTAPDSFIRYVQGRQPVVYPVADHDYTFDQSFLGGEVSVHSNVTNLSRSESDWLDFDGDGSRVAAENLTRGPAGTFARVCTEADWRRQIIGPAGMVFVPFSYVRGDGSRTRLTPLIRRQR
jgi:LPS-assembly protein